MTTQAVPINLPSKLTDPGAYDTVACDQFGIDHEGKPIVHARGFPYPLSESTLSELIRPKEQDLFR